jgi:hypothetical protein
MNDFTEKNRPNYWVFTSEISHTVHLSYFTKKGKDGSLCGKASPINNLTGWAILALTLHNNVFFSINNAVAQRDDYIHKIQMLFSL